MTPVARYGRRETDDGWGARPGIATAASEEQRVTQKESNSGADQTSDEVTVETTSVFRADFLNELEAPATAGAEGAVSGVEGLPAGSALLVVKRGPNAGSRFLLDNGDEVQIGKFRLVFLTGPKTDDDGRPGS
jgi:hypothetical protein